MVRLRNVWYLALLIVGLFLVPAPAAAQSVGIAGVVRDPSGAVLPGVTVEAESPALIERARSAVTDGQGLYSLVGLRPGVYSVTFTLAGFSTVKREGIELSGTFTATVNIELKVGALEETLTVTGEAPAVDIRNIVQQKVLPQEVQDTLASGRYTLALTELIPGVITSGSGNATGHDVGGLTAARGASMIHGSRTSDTSLQLNGAPSTLGGSATSASWQADPLDVQEYVFETGALSAESWAGGVRTNVIPKEGGNRFVGGFYLSGTNENFITNNITQELKDRQLQKPNYVSKAWDINGSYGGPLITDRLWFHSSVRQWANNQVVAGMFRMIDPRSFVFNPTLGVAGNADENFPAQNVERNRSYGTRVTYQATPKNKFSIYFANQPRGLALGRNGEGNLDRHCACAAAITGQISYEGGYIQANKENRTLQATWKAPISNKVLLEAMATDTLNQVPRTPPPENQYMWDENIVSVADTGTGFTYRSKAGAADHAFWKDNIATGSISYVTGSHNSKFGAQYEYGYTKTLDSQLIGGMTYTFNNGAPTRINLQNGPANQSLQFKKLGLYAQDQWTYKRATINAGVRFDNHVGSTEDGLTTGPNAYAALQTWPGIKNAPNWKDISPRLGVAYDLFGDGKTALKYTLSRYVVTEGTTFVGSLNPVSFNLTANRPWNDVTACVGGIARDFVPQPCELGTLSNSAFATAATTTRVDDAIREGWGVRQYQWETSASIQQEIIPQVSVSLAYMRRTFNNFTVTDNQSLLPADYDEYCITAPTDPALGSVSGSQICGLYDLNPAKRTVTPANFITDAKNYGTIKESWSGIDLLMTARLPHSTLVQGGLATGTGGNNANNLSACLTVDSPQAGAQITGGGLTAGAQRFCDVTQPWRHSIKFLGNTQLPYGVGLGMTYQMVPEPQIQANYTVTNAMITSGLVKFINPARTTFGGGSAVVNLIEPGTEFLPYLHQVDMRVTKEFRLGGRVRAHVTLDIANVFNRSAVQLINNTYGTSWQRPTYILLGRVVKPGVTLDF